MRIGYLTLVLSGLWVTACSAANPMDPRVFDPSPGSAGDRTTYDEDPLPEGYAGAQPTPGGQGGNKSQGAGGSGGKGGSKAAAGGASGSGASTAGTSGMAPTAGSGGTNPEPGAGAGSGETGGNNAGGSEATAGSGGTPPGCTYPSSGFGTSEGSVVAPDVSWEGYAPGASLPSTISVSTFFDCSGATGVNAVLLVYGAGWCTACQDEAALLPQLMQTWGPAGIVVVELLVETSGGTPASAQTAQQWKDFFDLGSQYVAADPSFQLQSAAADSFPYKVLVDPRTMTIVSTYTGGIGDDAVMQLALKNK
jgi:thiol-disulfide isomerase/thioredoxin